MIENYEDGEVIGVDTNGMLILWDEKRCEAYNSGETLEDFGEKNLTDAERKRLNL